MSQYFSKVTNDHYTLKNKLQRAADAEVRAFDRCLINSKKDADYLAKELIDRINIDLLVDHPRCKSLHAYLQNSYDGTDEFFLNVPGVIRLEFYKVTGS